jgi:DNA-binding beta-propeller fold protein YncE
MWFPNRSSSAPFVHALRARRPFTPVIHARHSRPSFTPSIHALHSRPSFKPFVLFLLLSAPVTAQAPDRDYVVLVASEAVDAITRVRFGPGAGPTLIKVEATTTIGINPREPDGPHGIAVSPDGRHYYVTTAHGDPYGYLWKVDARTNEIMGRMALGNFPATAQVTPDGGFVYVVNFNLHGEMEPSSVSVVSAEPFVEVARIQTCTMPHGSRLNRAGTKHYSACMMDDMVVEIDTRELSVSRHFMLKKGSEHGMAGAPRGGHAMRDSSGVSGHGMETPKPGTDRCSPTWAQPSADGSRVYVACNQTNDIVEIDATSWTVKRRIPAGDGVYNLAVTRDGALLVATNKRGRSVSIIDIASGKELARVATLRRVVHGVVISADDRYAFVSVEGVGSEPGMLEVIDLRTKQRVASADLGQMAGGIDLLKTP